MNMPLSGVRVLELGTFIAIPYGASLLAALGAEIIKIEPLPPGDPFRRGRGSEDPSFAQYNAGKKSIAVNLKTSAGQNIVRQLLHSTDIFMHNLRPGKAEDLGLGYESLSELHPGLIYVAVSGFGNTGPLATRPGYDSVAQSASGLYSAMSEDGAFEASGIPLADNATGAVAAIGACAALANRVTSGAGTLVETSLFEVSTTLSTAGLYHSVPEVHGSDTRRRPDPPLSARAQAFCISGSDARDIVTALGDDEALWDALVSIAHQQGQSLLSAFARLNYEERVEQHEELKAAVQRAFEHLDSDSLLLALKGAGIKACHILTFQEAVPIVTGSGHQNLDPRNHDVDLIRTGLTVNGEKPRRGTHVPYIGEHTNELLAELDVAGSVDELVSDRVIYQAPATVLSV
jgi:crotonobetainyl-CoA:carnitine CoA-transferase CaiB-like acyl-CoA transferase